MDNKSQSKSFNKIKNFIISNCSANLIQEVCGFIGLNSDGEYVATIEKNESPDPKNFFIINPIRFLKFKKENNILAVFHSHICGDENPSEFDIKMSETCCLPFLIYSLNTKKFNIYEPKNKDFTVNLLDKLKKDLYD